jgi:four helix bundle protein
VTLAVRFEDLRAWQAARALTLHVYALVRRRGFATDFAVGDQIRRAAVSTMNNIAEGFDSASPVEFSRFLRYASRSASDVQSCLYVAKDQHYIDQVEFDIVHAEAATVRKLCAALIRSLGARHKHARPPLVKEPPPPPYRSLRGLAPKPPTVGKSPVTGHRPPVTSLNTVE